MLQQGLRRKSSKSSWVGASICFHFELIFCHLSVRQYVLCQLINQSHSETFIINSFSGSRDCNILLTPPAPFLQHPCTHKHRAILQQTSICSVLIMLLFKTLMPSPLWWSVSYLHISSF